MSDQGLSLRDVPSLILPTLVGGDGNPLIKQRNLPLEWTKKAESRVLDTRTVNPATYADLEYVYSMSFKELRDNFADLGLLITRADDHLEHIRAKLLLEDYRKYLLDKPRGFDTPDARRSFVQLDPNYKRVKNYLNLLNAYEKLIEGRIKHVEKVCAYMKKNMDLIIRGGSHRIYDTQGKT